jgi:hypothetical protein
MTTLVSNTVGVRKSTNSNSVYPRRGNQSTVYKYKALPSKEYTTPNIHALHQHNILPRTASRTIPKMTSYPLTLPSLTPREAITDALHRCFIGIDRNDAAMFESAFAGEDIHLSHSSAPKPFTSLSALTAGMFARVGPMDTTHMLSNARVDHGDGGDAASMTAYALSQHAPPGMGRQPDGPKYTTGVDYAVDLVRGKEDGVWRISKAVLNVVWTQGDQSIMGGPPPAQ